MGLIGRMWTRGEHGPHTQDALELGSFEVVNLKNFFSVHVQRLLEPNILCINRD